MNFLADFKDIQFVICSLGLCEGNGICHPLPANLKEPKQIINSALQTVTKDILQHVWEELENRMDVCNVSGRTSWKSAMKSTYLCIFHSNLQEQFLYCSTLSLFSFINLDHVDSVIFTSQVISNFMKHPECMYMRV